MFWNDAALRKLSLDRAAFVMPSRTASALAGSPPCSMMRSFVARKTNLSTSESGRNSVSPASVTRTRRVIWAMMVSKCLSSMVASCVR